MSPTVINPLVEAFASAYWFRSQLKTLLSSTTREHALVAQYPWEDKSQTKRDISRSLVEFLFENQHKYKDTLVNLLLSTADIPNPIGLKDLEDGETKYKKARNALDELNGIVAPYRAETAEVDAIRRRAETEKIFRKARKHKSEAVASIKQKFLAVQSLKPQERGYALEKILNELFDVHELNARGPFALKGEQIDGAFELDGTHIIVEAKWHQELVAVDAVSYFDTKLNRRLDNTLGLFVSMNGFQKSVPELIGRSGRHKVLLMDGGDLMAVLEERIPLEELLRRKKAHAAHTGDIWLSAWQILSG